jgi:invasion protein IalB
VLGRLFFWLLLLGLGAAAGYGAAKLVPAHDAAIIITAHQDWRLVCPPANEQPCHADQDVVDEHSGAVLDHLSIAGLGGTRSMTITVSHNLLLPPGIALKIGNTPAQSFAYDYCDRVGCIVPVSIDANGEANLRAAERGTITVVNMQNKSAMIPFSLRGVGSALDALDREQGARAQWWRRIFL